MHDCMIFTSIVYGFEINNNAWGKQLNISIHKLKLFSPLRNQIFLKIYFTSWRSGKRHWNQNLHLWSKVKPILQTPTYTVVDFCNNGQAHTKQTTLCQLFIDGLLTAPVLVCLSTAMLLNNLEDFIINWYFRKFPEKIKLQVPFPSSLGPGRFNQ